MPRRFEYMKSTLGLLDLLHCTLGFVRMCTFGGYVLWALPEYKEIRRRRTDDLLAGRVDIVDALIFWGFAIDVLGPTSIFLYLVKFAFGSELCTHVMGLFHFATGMLLLLLTFATYARFCEVGFFCPQLQIQLILVTCISVLYVFSGFMTCTEVEQVERIGQTQPLANNRGVGEAQAAPPNNRSQVGIAAPNNNRSQLGIAAPPNNRSQPKRKFSARK